jgi:predicted GNAT superfamily acetyltransferase
MPEVALLPVSPAVEPAVLALNNAHAAELSWLDRDRLTLLLRQAFHARAGGRQFRRLYPAGDDDRLYTR